MTQQLDDILEKISEKFDKSFDESHQNHPPTINPEQNNQPPTSPIHLPSQAHQTIQNSQELEHRLVYSSSVQQIQSQSYEEDKSIQQQQASLRAETQEDTEGHCYQELNLKFEQALNKLNLKKLTSTKSTSSCQFIARMEQYQERKSKELTIKRKQREEKEFFEVSQRPIINSHSQAMLNAYTPIHERYDEVIRRKNKRIEQQLVEKQRKDKEEHQRLENQQKQREKQLRERVGQVRSQSEYYESMLNWSRRRNEQIQCKAKQKEEKQKIQIPFQPKINQKSKNMMKKAPKVPIYQKVPKQKQWVDTNCTFKPKIIKSKVIDDY